MSKKALELYHKHGLLSPAYTDARTGYRYYTATQRETVREIRGLQAVGFTLAEIGEIQRQQDGDYLKSALEAKLSELQQSMEALTRAMNLAQDMIDCC